MKKKVYLGIDAGTSKLKIALSDINGSLIDSVDSIVPVLHPFETASEIDMSNLWDILCNSLNKLKARNIDIWNNIEGIGITGQGDGAWPIDKEGSPVRNAILWNDTRSKCLTIENIDEINTFSMKNNVTPSFSGGSTTILKWMKEYELENYNRTKYVLHCKDWLNYKLTGNIYTDYSDSSTDLMNIIDKRYQFEILELLDIKESISKYPELVPSTHIVGKVNSEASKQCGIKTGVPVIAGAIDIAAVSLGVGMNKVRDACTIVGTTLGNDVLLDEKSVDMNYVYGSILCHVIPDKYLRLMSTLNGTSSLDWVRKTLVPGLDYEEIENNLKNIPVGSKGIIYHPYIYGERAPFKEPFACGGFFGLKATHNKFDMLRAAYEAIAFSIYDCYKSLPEIGDEIHISGGGSNSDFLCQMISDSLGKKVLRPANSELGIKGILKTLHVGLNIDEKITNKTIYDKEFMPNLNNLEKYKEGYELFKYLQNDMIEFWKKRN